MADPRGLLHYGGVPVPFTASWSQEETFHLARCRFADGRLALCQSEARGLGKPQFGKPHAQRQRQVICDDLCDLCAKPLKTRTKVSLSHARPQLHSAGGGEILQVEPLLHRPCAATSLEHCPSLKRDVLRGTLMVRQVTRHRVQLAIMSEEYSLHMAGDARKAVGHAKVQLLAWIDRDAAWLEAGHG